MKLQWTKSGSVLSQTIRHLLNEPVSHFSFSFDNFLVIHSDLLGVGLVGRHKFLDHHEVVYEIDPGYTRQEEDDLYYNLEENFDDKGYDYKAFCYFSYRALLYKTIRAPIPKTSKYNDGRSFLCTEMAGLLPGWDQLTSGNHIDLSITSPYKLYKYMIPIYGKGS